MSVTLSDKVVVITGATSGIGLATAHEYAKQGAHLILAARRQSVLDEVVEKCLELGAGSALAHKADTTVSSDVQSLADAAVKAHGKIDIWINNAGTGVMGRFDEVPVDDHAQVVKVNLLGYMYGSHAALSQFKKQEYGTLIQNISAGAWMPMPLSAAYSATKAGLHGFTRALRSDYSDFANIHICAVYPTMVDTPAFGRAANYTGHKILNQRPRLTPLDVARVMTALATTPKNETTIGASVAIGRVMNTLWPDLLGQVAGKMFRDYFAKGPQEHVGSGEIYEPHTQTSLVKSPERDLRKPAKQGWIGTPAVAAVLGGIGMFVALKQR